MLQFVCIFFLMRKENRVLESENNICSPFLFEQIQPTIKVIWYHEVECEMREVQHS